MKKLLVFACACLTFTLSVARAANWGFYDSDRSWIGIHFKTNNVVNTNWYSVWDGGAGTFQNANFGIFNTSLGDEIRVVGYDTKTWKSAGGDVTGCEYFYTRYQEGNRGTPSFTSMGGGWMENLGGGNQKWGNANVASANIASGISTLTNRMEIYGRIDGTGDPSGSQYDNNNGASDNYNARFLIIPEGGMIGVLAAGLGWLAWRKR
jgi:hypothetical protein